MAHTPPLKDKKFTGPLVIGAIVIGGAFLFLHRSSGSSSNSTPTGHPGVSEAFDEAIAGLETQLGLGRIASATSLGQARYSYATAANQDAAAVKVAQLNGASADYLGGLQYKIALVGQQIYDKLIPAQVSIANTEASALSNIAQQQGSAQKQTSFWNNIGGIFGTILGAFGL